jgi:hypothetical protein
LDALIHARALRLLCPEQISGACPHAWFEPIDTAALAAGVACAAMTAICATYWLAPDARLAAMWCTFAFCAVVAFLLLTPLVAFPVSALTAMVGVVITWRAWRRDHVLAFHESTRPGRSRDDESPHHE